MDTTQAIEFLEKQTKQYRGDNIKGGMPEEIFFFATRMTPIVNVDLLIQDETSRTLLAWRDSFIWEGAGWHIPGGVVRYKETFEERLLKVAESEIGQAIEYDSDPIVTREVICPQDTRGHFVSILYRCFISRDFVPANEGLAPTDDGYLQWHTEPPLNLLKSQEMYRQYL